MKALLLAACAVLAPSSAAAQGRAWHKENRKTPTVHKKTAPLEQPIPSFSDPDPVPAAKTEEAPQPKKKPVLDGQTFGKVERGEMKIEIRTRGSVRAEEIFRLKSSIEGRIEEVLAQPQRWHPGGKRLAHVLNKEYAALMDAKATTPSTVLEERWRNVYQPTPIRCDDWCYILKVFARPKTWVQPQAVLVEAARKLRLVGRVRPGDAKWIAKGQLLTFWPRSNPRKKLQGRVESFIIDTQGMTIEPGGTFTVLLDHKHYLDPNTEWEGVIEAEVKDNVLRVPTRALIRVGDEVFLPIRVSTGITTHEITEITSGVDENHKFLFLEEAKLGPLKPHEPPPGYLPVEDAEPRRRAKARARQAERNAESPRTIRRVAPPIDVFPEDVPEDQNDRFPSDID